MLDSMVYCLTNGVFTMPKGVSNKRYTLEFKEHIIKTMPEENLSYTEMCRRFEVNSFSRIKLWQRIYLEEESERLRIERHVQKKHRPTMKTVEGGRRISSCQCVADSSRK